MSDEFATRAMNAWQGAFAFTAEPFAASLRAAIQRDADEQAEREQAERDRREAAPPAR